MTTEPTVYVVDDDPAVLKSLCWLIESVELPVEIYSSAREFLDAFDASWPGCLLLDVRMPGMSGLELQERLRGRQISMPVIVMTGYADVPTAVRALKSGAINFIEKPFNDQILLDSIHEAIEQDAQVRRDQAQRSEIEARLSQLTTRECEVMDLVVAGRSTKDIAADLGLSPKTVEVHRAHLMDKVQAGSVADLVRTVTTLRQSRVPNNDLETPVSSSS